LYDSFVVRYVVNDDSFLHVFWFEQFRDSALFRGDILAEYPKYFAPQGYVLLYKTASFFCSPLAFSKILPVVLFSLSAFYTFILLKQIAKTGFCVFLGVLIFLLAPCFLNRMAGGHARAFGFLLLLMFLYHWIRREPAAVFWVLVGQALFYPMMLLPSALAYALGFFGVKDWKVSLDFDRRKITLFLAALFACGLLVSWQYAAVRNPALGRMVGREEMLRNPAFYEGGRVKHLPLPPVTKAAADNLQAPVLLNGKVLVPVAKPVGYAPDVQPDFDKRPLSKLFYLCAHRLERSPLRFLAGRMYSLAHRTYYTGAIDLSAVFFIVFYIGMTFFLLGWTQKRIRVPVELIMLFAASILLYVAASLAIPRLFLPGRYLEYSLKIIGLICFCAGITDGISRSRSGLLRRGLRIAVIALFALFFSFNKNNGLNDFSRNEKLYLYAQTLPKDALIAGNPKLMDGIPLFSRRMVFVNYKESLPFLSGYWKTITRRTDDLFRAYYSADIRDMSALCAKYGISCIVVDEADFFSGYLNSGSIYFEPFNSRILTYAVPGKDFALLRIPLKYRHYAGKGVFAVNADDLARYAAGGPGEEEK